LRRSCDPLLGIRSVVTRRLEIVKCQLPTKSPWLNPIEPKWAHGQHKGVEPGRLLPTTELEERVSAALGADHAARLTIPDRVA
jgi:hypothetical protein